jgi:serine/threonine protein kinase
VRDDQVLWALELDDAYRVVRELAQGPSGRTELVMRGEEGPFVRKRIPAALANETAWRELIVLDEPLLPQVVALYRLPDQLVVVYRYIEGRSLRELVEAQGPLDATQARALLYDLCRAAGALHAHGIVHRDIAPGNVIVAPDGAHLVDLGIARQHVEGQLHDTNTLGTWGFAAPEQFGFTQTDARTDIYALGRLLGYVLTGVLPSDEGYEQALDARALQEPALVEVARKASAFEPSARYQTAEELVSALAATEAGAPPEAKASHEVRTAGDASSSTAPTPAASAPGPTPEATTDARVNAPRPSRPPRTLSELYTQRPLIFLGVVLLWVLAGIGLVILVATGIGELLDGNGNWKGPQYVVAAMLGTWMLSCARGATNAALGQGPYAGERHVIRRMLVHFILKCVLVAVLFFLLLVVLTAISPHTAP